MRRLSRKFPVHVATLICWFAGILVVKSVDLGAAPPRIQASEKNPRTIIIAIGIDRYTNPYWPSLKFAVQDAQRFSSVIGKGSELPVETVLLRDRRATTESIRATFQALRAQVNPHDRLVVYFSGHGTLAPGGEGGGLAQVLVTHDTDQSKPLATGLSHGELRRMLDRIPVRRKLLILATCHSGVGKSRLSPVVQELIAGNKGRVGKSPLMDEDATSEGFLVFAASARGETAREDSSLRSDIYTHFFLEATSAGDRDGDGQVTALEAHDYARQKTWAMTKGAQRPTLEGKSIGRFDFPLTGKKRGDGKPVLTAWESDLQGYGVRIRGGEKGVVPSGFVMKEGTNIVEVYPPEGDKPLAVFSVRASEGEAVNLDDVVRPAPFAASLDLSRAWLRDPRAGRVAEASGINIVSARGTWHPTKFGLPLLLGISGSQSEFSRSGAIQGLETSADFQAIKLEAGTRVSDLRGRFASMVLLLGRGQMDLTIKDERSGGASRFASNANLIGLDAAGGVQIDRQRDLFGIGGLRYEQLTFAFENLGKVRMDYVAMYVGMEVRIGARARRLQ